jgi:hypothetical protein
MTTKQSTFQRLPMMLATGVLSTGLLLTGCSNNDSVETEVAMDETADVTSQDSVTTDQTTAISTTDNKNDAEQQTITPDDNETTTDTAAVSDVINPAADDDKQPSLVKNPTQAGTPEDTVKQALDTLYYGDVKQAASYYKVDMANFIDELAKTQYAFQQTVEGVSITDTKYNSDKTRATISGELRLKDQSEPAPLTYELQKINGEWKILG